MSHLVAIAVAGCIGVLPACGTIVGYSDPHGPSASGDWVPRVVEPSARVASAGELPEGALPFDPPPVETLRAAAKTLRRDRHLRVVTFNIEYGDRIDDAARELLADPEMRDADLVFVQEVSGGETEDLARQLGLRFVYYAGSLRDGDQFGNGILSPHEIAEDWKIVLPHRNPFNDGLRIAVGSVVHTGCGPVAAYSVHNETILLPAKFRLEQSKAILKDASRRNLPAVIGGDFNTMDRRTRADTARLFFEYGYDHSSRGSGPTTFKGPLGAVLDHVFARGFVSHAVRTVPTEASDHRPLVVDLECSAEASPRAPKPVPRWDYRSSRR